MIKIGETVQTDTMRGVVVGVRRSQGQLIVMNYGGKRWSGPEHAVRRVAPVQLRVVKT